MNQEVTIYSENTSITEIRTEIRRYRIW